MECSFFKFYLVICLIIRKRQTNGVCFSRQGTRSSTIARLKLAKIQWIEFTGGDYDRKLELCYRVVCKRSPLSLVGIADKLPPGQPINGRPAN
jgi:hypothetical protein